MKKWVCIMLAAILLIMAVPSVDSVASQDVWSAFLPANCTDERLLSSFFKQQLKSMQSEWVNERRQSSQDCELLTKRVENAILKAKAEMLEKEIDEYSRKISECDAEIVRIGALLSVGSATRSELDELEDEKASLEKDLADAQNDLAAAQADLADLDEENAGTDPGWYLYGLYEDNDFWNYGLEQLKDYALSHDADYCDAVTQEQEALWTLWMDYTLRQAKGQDVPDEFLGLEVAAGDKISKDDLRESYDNFLVSIGVLDPSEVTGGTLDDTGEEMGMEGQDTEGQDMEGQDTEDGQDDQIALIEAFPGNDEESDEESEEESSETSLPPIAPQEGESTAGGPGVAAPRVEVSTEAPGSKDEDDGEAAGDEAAGEEEEEEEEEDQDSLYNEILDYQDKAQARMKLEDTLTGDIERSYDDLSASWENYVSLTERVGMPQEVTLKLNRVSYRVGEKTKEDYEAVIEEYKTIGTDLAEAEYKYRSGLYDLDLLTAGGMSYLKENPPEKELTDEQEETKGTSQFSVVTYTKDEPLANTFTFGVLIPTKMEREVTHFELWGGAGRIGDTTGITQTLFSPTIDESQLNNMRVYFLRDGEYVGNCAIDPSVPIGQVTVEIELR